MAIEYDKSGKLFQVDYQSPFGGIDSTAYASAIDPHNFGDMTGAYVEDNIIKPITAASIKAFPGLVITNNYLGYIPIPNYISTGGVQIIGYLVTDKTVIPVEAGAAGVPGFAIGTAINYSGPTTTSSVFNYLVINDIQTGLPSLYWTAGPWTEIWTFDTATNIATQLTNYCGGGVLGLLNNQLMNLGGNSAADGNTPNRISWSAPGEYGVFQPYDVTSGTGNYAAGFNDLPSTSDILTGFAAIGTVGYLFRTQGITQVNPTGNGILPFQFNHLWASELGIGSAYTKSISQYGATVCFVTDVGIYSLGLAGLSEIAGSARSYLYKMINNQNTTANFDGAYTLSLVGRVIPYLVNSPELMYIVSFPIALNIWQLFAIGINTGKTYNLGQPNSLGNSRYELSYVNAFLMGAGSLTGSRQLVPLIVASSPGSGQFNLNMYYFNNTGVGQITFRKEQLKFGYVPTVTKIGFLAALINTADDLQGTISISIDGGLSFNTAFPDIVIQGGVGNPGNGVIDNVYSDGVQSLERPQLIIKLTNIQVSECWYQGTLADFPLI